MIQQALCGQDEAGRAETALGRAVENPGFLQRMQMIGRAQPFQRHDLGVVFNAFHLDDAAADELAVHDDGAGAAMAFFATELHAGELELIAQHISENVVGIDEHLTGNAIDHKRLGEHANLLGEGTETRMMSGPKVCELSPASICATRQEKDSMTKKSGWDNLRQGSGCLLRVSICRSRTGGNGIRGSRCNSRRAPARQYPRG